PITVRERAGSFEEKCDGEEKMRFQAKWTNAYFVVPHGLDKVMCLICKQVNAMLKEFNIDCHYVTNHKSYDKFASAERNNKLQQLQRHYAAHMFTKMTKSSEAVTEARYVAALEKRMYLLKTTFSVYPFFFTEISPQSNVEFLIWAPAIKTLRTPTLSNEEAKGGAGVANSPAHNSEVNFFSFFLLKTARS
uniref:SPIN-DOC-like zinc-finger domain-containing protein n=1 Tax=Oryzias latipes TaxID=8090 RepID=A0A3P9HYB3_ORYLA